MNIPNWQTTLAGVLGFIALAIPPIQNWLTTTLHITPFTIAGLVVAVIGALAKDHTA